MTPAMPKKHVSATQMTLPQVVTLDPEGDVPAVRKRRIQHQKILEVFEGSKHTSAGMVDLYRSEVLTIPTRTIHLLGRKGPARIIHTLLGYEVQASFKRVHCPDLVTARYLKLFTEIGCRVIQLPYDPTITARLVPQFEDAFDRLRRGVRGLFPQDRRLQAYVLRQVCSIVRKRLRAP